MSTRVPKENDEEGAQSHGLREVLEKTFGVSALSKDSAGSVRGLIGNGLLPGANAHVNSRRSKGSARGSEENINARDTASTQLMKKTPNAEQVHNNLRADDKEWHFPALRLDACEGLAGKLLGSFVFPRCRCGPGNVFFGNGHGSTVQSVAHFTHFSDLVVNLQRCAKR